MPQKNWYKILNSHSPLTQGDIFFNCPVIVPSYKGINPENKPRLKATIFEYDVVILSQSCDLVNKKLEIALVSPIFTLSQLENAEPRFKSAGEKNKIRKYEYPQYYLLNKFQKFGFPNEYYIVDFHSVFGVPMPLVNDLLTKQKRRLTLISPYKEQLSQAFARFIMRVGLPSDIPEFK